MSCSMVDQASNPARSDPRIASAGCSGTTTERPKSKRVVLARGASRGNSIDAVALAGCPASAHRREGAVSRSVEFSDPTGSAMSCSMVDRAADPAPCGPRIALAACSGTTTERPDSRRVAIARGPARRNSIHAPAMAGCRASAHHSEGAVSRSAEFSDHTGQPSLLLALGWILEQQLCSQFPHWFRPQIEGEVCHWQFVYLPRQLARERSPLRG